MHLVAFRCIEYWGRKNFFYFWSLRPTICFVVRFYGRKRDKENDAVNYGNSSVKSELFRQRIDSPIRVHNKDKTQDATYSLYVGKTDISNA